VRGWLRRHALRTIHEFRVRLGRYQLQQRRLAKAALSCDPVVLAAMADHARAHGISEEQVRRRVAQYITEIVPQLNVLSYYKLGYNLAKILVNLLYKVSVDYQDEAALERIPKRDVVAYVLARGVHVSYAVGEWARAWPLEYVFKSFGAYFVRRRFREPLYHAVLERYVQLITKNGVTQGIFPEGGLTRDGRLRAPKLGLLDYICRTALDPGFARDIWLVPVALNYDRVLEDRALIRELLDERDRPGRLAQFGTVASYIWSNTLRLLSGRLRRYGRAAVNFPAAVARHRAARAARLAQGAAAATAGAPGARGDAPHRRRGPRDPRSARRGGAALVPAECDLPAGGARADGPAARPPLGGERQGGPRRRPHPRRLGPGLAHAAHAAARGGRR